METAIYMTTRSLPNHQALRASHKGLSVPAGTEGWAWAWDFLLLSESNSIQAALGGLARFPLLVVNEKWGGWKPGVLILGISTKNNLT